MRREVGAAEPNHLPGRKRCRLQGKWLEAECPFKLLSLPIRISLQCFCSVCLQNFEEKKNITRFAKAVLHNILLLNI